MTREEAKAILDAARAGKDVTPVQITLALICLGDITSLDDQEIVTAQRSLE